MEIRWHTGPRAEVRHLFELADDSLSQLDGYLHLGRVLVAVGEAGALVGHAQIVEREEAFELNSLAVAERCQGTGIGRALVERVIAECRASGARTLLVATATADTGVLRFYQRLGFRMLRIERDAFTPSRGYPDAITIGGVPLRDRVWLSQEL